MRAQQTFVLSAQILIFAVDWVISIPKKRQLTDVTTSTTRSAPKRAAGSRGRYIATRAPPPRHGEKPIPVGSEKCLAGYRFVITGVLESLEREEAADLIKVPTFFYQEQLS